MNRKSIIGLSVAAVLVIGYPVLSWSLGRAVHARFDAWERQLTNQPVQLFKVTDRKSTAGVFSSTEEVTLEFNGALFDQMMNSHKRASGGMETAASLELGAWRSAADVAAQSTAPRFTLRNEIKHGPFPGFTSVGLGRIDSKFVFSDEMRTQLDTIIPGRDPLTVSTRLDLLGGADVHVSSPAFEYNKDDDQIAWQGFEGDFSMTRNANAVGCDAKAPGFSVRAAKGGVVMEQMTLTCDLDRVFDVLYTGKANFEIASIQGHGADGKRVRVDRIIYATDMTSDGEFIDVAVKAGAGAAEFMEYQVTDLRYELSLRHLHGPTYAELSRKMQNSMWSSMTGDPTGSLALAGAIAEHGPKLLEYSPQLLIDHIGFTMKEGEIGIKGNAQFADFKRTDLASEEARAALLGKLQAQFHFWISEGLLNKNWSAPGKTAEASTSEDVDLPEEQAMSRPSAEDRAAVMRQQVEALEHQGYVTRKDGQLQAHIEFKGGALTVNGKPLGSP